MPLATRARIGGHIGNTLTVRLALTVTAVGMRRLSTRGRQFPETNSTRRRCMKTHVVRMQLVPLAVLVLASGPVSAQEHRPLSFALGANIQDATYMTNISSLGVVAGFGFDWPVGHTLALRADAAYSHFGKSLFSETSA